MIGKSKPWKHLDDARIEVAQREFEKIRAAAFKEKIDLKRSSKALPAAVGETEHFTEVRKTVHRLKKDNPRTHGLPNLIDITVQHLEEANKKRLEAEAREGNRKPNGKRKDERKHDEQLAAEIILFLVDNGLTTKGERAAALRILAANDFRRCKDVIEVYERRKTERKSKRDRRAGRAAEQAYAL